MSIDITNIIIALIGVLSAVITTVVVPLIKTKLNAKEIAIIEQLASIAVYAAQQIYQSSETQEKKDYAISYMKNELAKYNITISEDAISTYIEGVLKSTKINKGSEW